MKKVRAFAWRFVYRLRVLLRLKSLDRAVIETANALLKSHAKLEKEMSLIRGVLLSHVTCLRCGSMHHRRSTAKMKSPSDDEAYSCVWCVPVLIQRGFEVLPNEKVNEA